MFRNIKDDIRTLKAFFSFGFVTLCLGLLGVFLFALLWDRLHPICTGTRDCPLETGNVCTEFVCSEHYTCDITLRPGNSCDENSDCPFGSSCVDCQCVDPCDSISCLGNTCYTSECFSPGMCAITNFTSNCCETVDDCLDLELPVCYEIYCASNHTCGVRIANNGTCTNSNECAPGETCDVETCTCVNRCADVSCLQTPCLQEICESFSGECVQTASIPNCCVNSGDCLVSNVCLEPVCVDNFCSSQLKNTSMCAVDADCPEQTYCLNCNCTDPPPPECLVNSDCTQVGDQCIGRLCVNGECNYFSTPGCCTLDSNCEDNDACTIKTCVSGTCVFTQKDEDMDGIVCNVDCNDNNASIGAATKWCRDWDMDGFGNIQESVFSCDQPAGFSPDCTDCNDSDPNIYPGSEHCDFSLSQALADPFNPSASIIYTNCGTDTDVFQNLTAVVCSNGVFPGNLRGGKLQMWVSDNGIWVETALFSYSNPNTNPELVSVKIFGDLVVLGIRNDMDPMTSLRSGTIQIFRYAHATNTLTSLQTIGIGVSAGAMAGAGFGTSVAIHGTTIVAGAPLYDGPSGVDTGAVFVFDETAPNTWTLTQQINEPHAYHISMLFGWSVSIFGTHLIVGAPTSSTRTQSYAESYELVAGVWTFDWQYPVGGAAQRERIGYSVSIDDMAAVATSLSSSSGPQTEGTLFIFDLAGVLQETFIRPFESQAGFIDLYGYDVEISDMKIVVGVPQGDGVIARSGYAAIYFFSNIASTGWAYSSRLWPYDLNTLANSFFGTSVSICLNDIITAGAPLREPQGASVQDQGAVYSSECTREYTCNP